MALRQLISIREYARRNGCSDTNIRKAIALGRIVNGLVEHDGKKWIDPEIADAEWLPTKRSTVMPKSGGPKIVGSVGRTTTTESIEPSTSVSVAGAKGQEDSYKKAKTLQAVFAAKIAQLDYEERTNSLVQKDLVYRSLFAFGQEIRDAIEAVPARVVSDMLACNNTVEAQNILISELKQVLEKLANTPELK